MCEQSTSFRRCSVGLIAVLGWTGCTQVGPDFEPLEPAAATATWSGGNQAHFESGKVIDSDWWNRFDDPVLVELIERAQRNNNGVRVAGLRVLEAQARLGISLGNTYPQIQVLQGDATYARAGGVDLESYGLSAAAAWELDFWGKFKRGIEAADSALLASIASYDDAQVILTATVASTYTTIRTIEEQLRIARENIATQQRSYEIVEVLYRNGDSGELDVQQAETLLLSTKSAVPQLESALIQARNALSVLLGEAPGGVKPLLAEGGGFPELTEVVPLGLPATVLRLRPDVREAELLARAQNAQVGAATANLYPSFSINGSIGVSAEGAASNTDPGDLFDSDAIAYGFGPSFVWPFFNYDRIKNNVRIQDARLQQALVQYRQTVIQATREVEDAMATVTGARNQERLLEQTLAAARRSSELALLRYREGFSDYQRVLDAQRALFNQQERYISNRGAEVIAVIDLYRALGAGWESAAGAFVDEATQAEMEERTDWDTMIDANRELQAEHLRTAGDR
jgi:NodT family efflux transporter outer membrane factor (OMF) lipoprotein